MNNKTVSILVIIIFFIIRGNAVFSQTPVTNVNANQTYVNINMPRTPESSAFEKYGTFSVNEFSGTTNISIPIYTLQSRHLQVPITLSYQPTGIRVNQEASWVGLGFDINVGGRITVETRGSVDFPNTLSSSSNLRTGLLKLFNRLGTNNENAILTFASFCENNAPCPSDPIPDNLQAIQDMTEFGVGEPDIFRANFLGHSIAFYFDKTTTDLDLKWIGEQSTFRVDKTQDSYGRITGWTIKDDDGNTYYFNQTETTTNTIPANAIVPTTTTSAWLLTRMEHPSGDYIQFTYNNYGYAVPAFTMSGTGIYNVASVSGSISSDNSQNVNLQSPYYLTRMETENVAVDFVLGTRTDLYGPGSRRLNQINITDKFSNTIKKTASFSYSYLQGAVDANSRAYLNSLFYNLPSPLSQTDYIACSNSRLKLESLTISGNNASRAPYNFYYNTFSVPDKYSLSQDHWGYYNNIYNQSNGYRFSHLIPLNGQFGVQPVFNGTPSFSNAIGPYNLGFSRDCDSQSMQAMMLNKIVYPTGGCTEFVYEPHTSQMITGTTQITGGGLRIKTINNYTSEGFAGSTEYTYYNGKYMGTIEYYTGTNTLNSCSGSGFAGQMKLSSNGAVNYNDILVGYGQITIIQKDQSGITNGSIVKSFDISTPSSSYANGTGFDVRPAHWPWATNPPPINTYPFDVAVAYLNAQVSGFAPTPSSNLQGKLIQEQYYNNGGTLLKSTNYNYILSNYTNNFYDVKAIENRIGGFDLNCGSPNRGTDDGLRPVMIFVSPAKSFHSLLNNVVDVTYSNGNPLTKTQYYTYNSYYQVHSKQTVNSDGSSTTETYQYPIDLMATGSTTIYDMVGRHIFSPLISTIVTVNGTPLTVNTSNYFNPSQGVYVPQNVQTQVKTNPVETRYLYNSYDTYGHLLEGQKANDVKEVYLWGYHTHFPVARVVGSDSTSVSGIVSTTILNEPVNDAALRQELNKLRVNLPNAFVTTYTYDPVYGVTSQTDPAGRSTYFHYDGLGRLSYISDKDNNIVKTFCYNYAGQQENCQVNTTPLWQSTGVYQCIVDGSGQNTGYQQRQEKDNNPNSLTYNQTRWIDNGYNSTVCQLPVTCNYSNCTSQGEGYGCINGQCEYGFRINTGSYYDYWSDMYECVYHYEFSDGSWSQDYSDYSYWPCPY